MDAMYKDKWGLTDKPFQNVPDTRFLFYSASHEEALVRLLYCVTESKGLMLLLGRWGVGKTFICRAFKEKVRDKGFDVAIFNPPPSSVDEFVYHINDAFLPPGSRGRIETYKMLADRAKSLSAEGREMVVVLDEAQFIRDPGVLEEVRLLLDITQGGRFLVNVVMSGVPELWNTVNAVQGLSHRLGIWYRIEPLNRDETEEYVMHRLKIAGLNHNIFLKDAIDLLYRESEGVPARINSICDLAMLIATGEGVDDIEAAQVRAAAEEIAGTRVFEGDEAQARPSGRERNRRPDSRNP